MSDEYSHGMIDDGTIFDPEIQVPSVIENINRLRHQCIEQGFTPISIQVSAHYWAAIQAEANGLLYLNARQALPPGAIAMLGGMPVYQSFMDGVHVVCQQDNGMNRPPKYSKSISYDSKDIGKAQKRPKASGKAR